MQLYADSGFRGAARGSLFPGTYKVSAGFNFSGVASWLVPADLELTACTAEVNGVGASCQLVHSGDLPAALFNQVRVLTVRQLPIAVPLPPCPAC